MFGENPLFEIENRDKCLYNSTPETVEHIVEIDIRHFRKR